MMNKEQFTKELVEVIQLRLGESYSVEHHYVTKNNGIQLLAVVIREKHQTVCPTIYIDGYYEEYRKGKDLLIIAKDVIDIYITHSPKDEYDFVGNIGDMHDRIMCKLVNTEANKLILDNAPHKDFLDLSVLYYIDYGTDEDGYHKMLTITNMIMELIGLTPSKLDELATANMARLSKPRIESMLSIMLKASGMDDVFGVSDFIEDDNNMYVISNESKFHGAVSILHQDILKDFATQMNTDTIWILPSSIHEMILVLNDGSMCSDDFNQMIQEVNETEVEPQEVLSSHCYIYNRQTDSISVA